MPSTPPLPAGVRPAAVVNAEIRALVRGAGRRLTDEERAVYERLVAEWTVADTVERACGEIVKAA